jgi:hypothetical protein
LGIALQQYRQNPTVLEQFNANGGWRNPNIQTNLGVVLGTSLVSFLLMMWVINSRKNTTQRGEQQQQQVLAWNTAMARWVKLYYCFRCDVVYVEGEKAWASPEGMQTLLSAGARPTPLSQPDGG